MRLLRLALGIWAVIATFQTREAVLGLIGGLLLVMALMNIGCCGVSGCGTLMTTRKNPSKKQKK